MTLPLRLIQLCYILLLLACFIPAVTSAEALFAGMAFALLLKNPFAMQTKKGTAYLLQAAIIGLGAGMNLMDVMQAGMSGFFYTLIGIASTIALGLFLGKILKSPRGTSLLLTAGTAICGGSAIAATAVTTRAKSADISMALAIVFTLNAVALFIFPPLGHWLGLTQRQFGLLSALAIHDTSSVVGSAMVFGPEALAIATIVKLTRTLWIIPVAFLFGYFCRSDEEGAKGKFKIPWFIGGFLLASALVTWIPDLATAGHFLQTVSKRLLVVALFFIGSGLDRATLKTMGPRPLIQGIILWIAVIAGTLTAILQGFIA